MQAVKKARRYKYILLNAPNDKIPAICTMLPGIKSPTIIPLVERGWSSIHSVIHEDDFWNIIEQLKEKGYKFLQIKGYAHNNRIDYIQPYYLMLIPFKEFPKDPHDIEIYEPTNSEILSSWADDEMGVKVMVFHDNRSCL